MLKLVFASISIQILFCINLLSNNLEFTKVHPLFKDGEFVVSVENYDSTNCVLLTDHSGYAKIYISFNGGLNWQLIYSNYKKDMINVMDIAYPAKNNIFVLYDSYLIVKYNDNGTVLDSMILGFEPDKDEPGFRSRRIEMIDTLTGVACIENKIVFTTNGWKTHKIFTPDSLSKSDILTVSIQDKNIFCGINTKFNYFKTTDGGNSFSNSHLSSSGSDIFFLNSQIGFILGSKRLEDFPLSGKPIIHKTTNGGNSWDIILDTIIEPRNSGSGRIEMLNELEGIFVETRGTVVTTIDGFKTFKRIYLDGVGNSSSASSISYSGNRPIIAVSNLGIFTTIPDSILINMPIPELIEPQDKSTTMTTDINFKWRNAEGIFQYVFHLSSNADFSDTLRLDTLEHDPLQTINQEYFLNDLMACTEYYWKVASFKEGRVKWSVPFSFNTGKIPVTQIDPSNNATEIEYDTDVNWKELNGAERYHLQCSYISDFNDLFFSQDTLTNTSHLLEDLPEDTEIFWRVRGYCKEGFADWSEVWKFRTKKSTSVRYSEDYRGIRIKPNPTSDFITIQFSNKELQLFATEDKVQIFDMLGIEIMSESIPPMTGSHRMNVEKLPAGVYFIRIGTRVEKFVKM